MHKDILELQNDDALVHATTKTLQHRVINLGTIYINQDILELEEGDIITYEIVSISTPYRLHHTYSKALSLIFDAKEISLVSKVNTLEYFVVTLRDESKIYLIVKTANKKRFSMVYGKNRCLFENAMKSLQNETYLHQCAKVHYLEHEVPVSKWNSKLIILDGLLEMVPKMRKL